MAKATKRHRGIANVRLVGQLDLQDCNVSNHGGRNGGNEEEHGRGEEENGANMVEDAWSLAVSRGRRLSVRGDRPTGFAHRDDEIELVARARLTAPGGRN
jgi:hypothetical protein